MNVPDGIDEELVVPLAGAWIETLRRSASRCIISVAPIAGAWIEALLQRIVFGIMRDILIGLHFMIMQ